MFRRLSLNQARLVGGVALVVVAGVVLWFGLNPKHRHADFVLPFETTSEPTFDALDQLEPLPGYGTVSDLIAATENQSGPFVVNFFASWCRPCLQEHGTLIDLQAEMPGALIGIAFRDDPVQTAAYLDANANPYTAVAADVTEENARRFGLSSLPQTFLFDEKGHLLHRTRGPLLGKELQRFKEQWRAAEKL